MDIPEDFEVSNFDGTITSATVQVPAGARFLFVAAADSFFSDNSDPDGDFGVRITVQAVPEPSGLLLAGAAFAGLLGAAGRRKAAHPERNSSPVPPGSRGA